MGGPTLVENESIIYEAAERGLISTVFGCDVLVLRCKDALFFRIGPGRTGLTSGERECGDCE
jgi:hypothetical protein